MSKLEQMITDAKYSIALGPNDCCPKCKSSHFATERRPDGNSTCLNCKYSDSSTLFIKGSNDTSTKLANHVLLLAEVVEGLMRAADEAYEALEYMGSKDAFIGFRISFRDMCSHKAGELSRALSTAREKLGGSDE